MNKILEVAALIQGSFLIAVCSLIIIYYCKVKQKELFMHVILISLSYILISCSTIITIFRGVYKITDAWQLTTFIGYVLGDISLFNMLKHVADKLIERK